MDHQNTESGIKGIFISMSNARQFLFLVRHREKIAEE